MNSGNYDLSYQGNNLTITKALLNVIADGKTKVYGDADPSLTYQVSGLKNGRRPPKYWHVVYDSGKPTPFVPVREAFQLEG